MNIDFGKKKSELIQKSTIITNTTFNKYIKNKTLYKEGRRL